jgi:uncharacterized protein with PQ loop repeat
MQLPQLFANYKAKSADGLSMAFLIVWLLGDVTNLIGGFPLKSAFLHTYSESEIVCSTETNAVVTTFLDALSENLGSARRGLRSRQP